jgi:shikimate kinase
MIIFLTGFMGAGKTTAGKKLASVLSFEFIDLDRAFEAATSSTISELFNSGESAFRKIESSELKKTAGLKNVIVATGGGTPCFEDNLEWMNGNGITVYLKLSAGSLFRRLAQSKTSRPLLKNLNDVELMEYIVETLSIREKYYKKAAITVKGESLDIAELALSIKDRFNSPLINRTAY